MIGSKPAQAQQQINIPNIRQTGKGYFKEIKEIKQLWKVLKAPFELSANSRPSSSKGTMWTMDKGKEQKKGEVERKTE